MRIGDTLYFSPNYRFDQINWNNKEELIEAFRDRVEEFYLKPARVLNKHKYPFGSGVLCVTTIDFLAKIETDLDDVGKRFENWLRSNIKEFDSSDPDNSSRTLACRFYKEFRNGLVHEGRIKNCGQFSYDFDELVHQGNGIIIVNPNLLLNAIISSFRKYIQRVESEEFAFLQFRCALIKAFWKDIKYVNR